MIRAKISSDFETLDKLNKIYPWIPNSISIRPSPEDIERKKQFSLQIQSEWKSYRDYVYCKIFQQRHYVGGEDNEYKKFVRPEHFKPRPEWCFQPSMFRYNLIPESNHWVLWNSEHDFDHNYPDEIINQIITRRLFKHLILGAPFQFVWYKNPKPTIPEFYHVQVFWISGINKTNIDKHVEIPNNQINYVNQINQIN
jgi:hypothetical protein